MRFNAGISTPLFIAQKALEAKLKYHPKISLGNIVTIAVVLIGAVTAWNTVVSKQAQLEEKVAVMNPASREACDDFLTYLKQYAPDGLRVLGPSAGVLIGLAGRFLRLATGRLEASCGRRHRDKSLSSGLNSALGEA